MSAPLYLREDDVDRLLTAREVTNVLEQSFLNLAQGRASLQPRVRVVQDKYVLHNLPAISAGLGFAAIKSYLTGPAGVTFVTLLFELASTRLVAVIESNRLGQLRTGCATALAARYLAPSGDLELGLVGTGTVAQGQLEALDSELGDRLKVVRVFGRSSESRQKLVDWASERLQRAVTPCESVELTVRGANLVVTATSSASPVLQREHLGSAGLLCAVGSNWAHRSEVAPAAVLHCRQWWVDNVEQAHKEAGDLVQCPGFDWSVLGALDRLVSQPPERLSETGWVFFKSLGLGLEDLAAAALVYELARERGLGTSIA